MATGTPGNAQPWVVVVPSGIGLIIDTRLIQIVSTDSAGVRADGPRPHGDGIPFLDFEALSWCLD